MTSKLDTTKGHLVKKTPSAQNAFYLGIALMVLSFALLSSSSGLIHGLALAMLVGSVIVSGMSVGLNSCKHEDA